MLLAILDEVAGDEPLGYYVDDDGVVVITTQGDIDEQD